jgi:hypothetical protein
VGGAIATPPRRPRIIELIGPAGAGKSEVAAHLARMPGVLCTSIWQVPVTDLVWASLSTIPSAATLMRRAGAPLSRELRQIARLRALLNFLDRDELDAYRFVVLDEGAIYTLAWLHVIGHQAFSDLRTAGWRDYVAALWAATIDEVIQLDAADSVLAHRLRTRAKQHVMAHAPERTITAFSMRYRSAYNCAIGTIQRHGRMRVRDFRTDSMSAAEIAARIVALAEPAPLRELVHG